MRFILLLCLLFTTAAFGQNPLDRPKEPPYKGPADLPIKLTGDDLTVDLERRDGGQVYGRIMFGADVYQLVGAFESVDRMTGAFVAGADTYAFTLELSGGEAVFKTGDASYQLKRPANPLSKRAADPMAGEWSGAASEPLDDGSTAQYPMRLSMRVEGEQCVADVRLEMTLEDDFGRPVKVRADGAFKGAASNPLSLEAADTTVTIVATGERDSLGAQQIRAEVKGDVMTGRIGNDRDGWATFEIRRASAAPVNNVDTPRGAGVTLRPVTLTDAGMGGAVSHTLLAPADWRVEGGVTWSRPELYQDFVHLDLRVTGPDGSAYSVYPGGVYQWTNGYDMNPGFSRKPNTGDPLPEGVTFMAPVSSTSEYVTKVVMPASRPGATDVRVAEVRELTEVLQLNRELSRSQYEAIERDNAQYRQLGGGVRMELTQFADLVRVSYREGGQAFEEEIYVIGWSVLNQAAAGGGTPINTVTWGVQDLQGVRTPAGAGDASLANATGLSLRADQRWQAVILEFQAQIARGVMEGIVKRGEIRREAMDAAWKTHQESVRTQEQARDKVHHKFVNYIRDVEDYSNGAGASVQLPSGYNHVYANGQGGYVLSHTPLQNSAGWTQIQPVR